MRTAVVDSQVQSDYKLRPIMRGSRPAVCGKAGRPAAGSLAAPRRSHYRRSSGAPEDGRPESPTILAKEGTAMFAETLKRPRKAAGPTQESFAEKAGIPVGTVRNGEQGIREPRSDVLLRLANVLGVGVDQLLGKKTRTRR